MSSHHIVREKQEPALLILGLENFSDELLGQLLEWSPTVIVTADTAERLNSMGIKVDVVIDPDTELQSDTKSLLSGGDKSVATALKYLLAGGYPAVNIVTDEFLVDDYLPYINNINIVVFHNNLRIYPVNSGFGKWKPAGETIYILGVITPIKVTGLKYVVNDEYVTVADGFFTLRFTAPYVFIAESIL